MLLARRQVERSSSIIVLGVGVDRAVVQEVFNRPYVSRGGRRDNLGPVIDAGACVEIKILRRVSMAWRCRILTARPSQGGRVIAEK